MVGLLVQLIPLALYTAFAPVAVLVCILLLEGGRRYLRAGSYVLGYGGALVAVGVAAVFVFHWAIAGAVAALLGQLGQSRGGPTAGGQALGVCLGLVLLGIAGWLGRRRPARGPAGAAPPAWLGAVEAIGPWRAFGVGALLLLTNVDNVVVFLAGVNEIDAAGLSGGTAVLVYALFVLLSASGVLAPLAIAVLRPGDSAILLGALAAWLGRASQTIVVVLLAAIGGWLVAKGLWGLLT